VELWIDDPDLRSIVYKYNPDLVHFPLHDLRRSYKVFEAYDCQSIKSFIKEVMPELEKITPTNRSYYSSGLVKPLEFPKSCLTIHSEKKTISVERCKANYTLQIWSLTYLNDLRIVNQICAEVQPNLKLGFDLCHMLGGRQSWHYDALNNHLVSNTMCLELGGEYNMFLAHCDKSNRKQRWILENTNISVMQSANN